MNDRGFCMLVRPTTKFGQYYNFLKKNINEKGTVLIYSMWAMYIEPTSKHKKENYFNFANQFPLVEKKHTSGHASPECIADVCKLVNPSLGIIPIHGERMEDFYSLNISDLLKEKISIATIYQL